MAEIQTVYLILGALGIFVIGAFWGRNFMWRLGLTAGYLIWRLRGGVKRLLDRTGVSDLRQLFQIDRMLTWTEEDEDVYWAQFPMVALEDEEHPSAELFVGDTLEVGDFWKRQAFCEKLRTEENDASIILLKVTFHYVFAYAGACAETVCHRRMSLPFLAYCTHIAGLTGCPICHASFDKFPLRAPASLERTAKRRVAEAIARMRSGENESFKFFVPQHSKNEQSAICAVRENVAQLRVFFGEESALRWWSQRMEKRLRPPAFDVVVPKR